MQRSRANTTSSPPAVNPVRSPPTSSKRPVSSAWKFWERCRVWTSSTCRHWTPAAKVEETSPTKTTGYSRQLTFSKTAGTLDNPIVVRSFGDEQYLGCTGCPADSHVVIWLTTSRDRPIERCPECGSVYKLEYVGPQDDGHGHDHGHGHDAHGSSDGQHNYEGEPKTMADFVRPEYR